MKFSISVLVLCSVSCLFIFAPSHAISKKIPAVEKQGGVESLILSLVNVTQDEPLVEEMKIISPMTTIAITVSSVPKPTSFLIFQAHSFIDNATLSYNKTLVPHYHVNGTNIGLIHHLTVGTPTLYLSNFNDSKNITVLVVVVAYNKTAPIPGGCNMEFPIEEAPYLEVRHTTALISVKSQLAAPAAPRSCFSSSDMDYDVYHYYLPERDLGSESYFTGIRNMLTLSRIQKYGKKTPLPIGLPSIQRIFSAYPGTGSVYAVVVHDAHSSSVYVPDLTYACSAEDTCEVLNSTFAKCLCAITLFLGLFVCFVGHRFFLTEMFISGFLSGGLVAYILVSMPGTFDYGIHLVVAVLLGVICGLCWITIWWFYAIPVLSTILVCSTLGYIVATIVIFAGPGDMDFFQSDLNFWTAFLCIMLFVPVLLVATGHYANILACSVVGSFAIIAPIDHYLGSNLKYILINNIRRATVPEFRTAIIDPPFQTKDLALAVSWVILAILGFGIQIILQKGKPPFPPPSTAVLLDRREFLSHAPIERRPLLSQPQHSYATMEPGGSIDNVYEPSAGPSTVTP